MNRSQRRAKRAEEGRLMRRIDGGCDDCTAYSDLIDHGGGVYVLAVRHDESCPAFRARQARTNHHH